MRNSSAIFRNLALGCLALSGAIHVTAASTPKAIDRGALDARARATPISLTIALGLPALDDAEKLLRSINTPGDPQYHQFLTAEQFVERFAPANADVSKAIAALAKLHLTAQLTTATTLRVTGLPVDIENAFSVSLHTFEVPAHDNVRSYTYHAALTRATVPPEIALPVAAIVGLDNSPSFHPHYLASPPVLGRAKTTPASSGNAPGQWTVTDFANYYDVNPLYKQGLSGSGRTIGIMTLASFTPSDAFAYWKALGLKVSSSRIKIVTIDGGPGAPSDASGSLETTIDVEQSGGIAPGANIIVYEAPNTSQGFTDMFASAIDANKADTLSTSWGAWEWLWNLENAPVTDPITGRTVGASQAVHELLLRAGIQGQSTYAASGDGGAYDVNHDLGCFGPFSASDPTSCSLTLSVDYPASDTAITAAGGTTLPGLQQFCLNAACTAPFYNVTIQHESVWGWDYLDGLCKTLGFTPITCGIFPAGTGGGVSIMFALPQYQFGIQGTQFSQPHQFFEGFGTTYALPAFYPGRNVPDVSFNADPDTGYVVYYTSNVTGFGIQPGWGGTSFVAPQLNGVTALLDQNARNRVGLLNSALYSLVLTGQAYRGHNAPLNVISNGDNWFYHGNNGYSPAVGVGTMDVANFAESLRSPY